MLASPLCGPALCGVNDASTLQVIPACNVVEDVHVEPLSEKLVEEDANPVSVNIALPMLSRVTVCGLSLALSLTLNVPAFVPVAVGEKTTLILHELVAPKLVAQVVEETLKFPVVPIKMPFSATACLLLSVKSARK